MELKKKRDDLSNLESKWFAFYVLPHCEKTAYSSIVRKGFEGFLPIKKELHQWSDRKKWVETPLLSSYVFAKIKREDYFSQIKLIDKIVKIVDIGGEIYSIPEVEIEWLRKISTSGYAVTSESTVDFQYGNKAKVKSGPLTGLEGKVFNHLGKNKFVIELTLLKRVMMIEISGGELEKI